MTSLKFVLFLTGLFLWRITLGTELKLSSTVHQVGDNVTLRCFSHGDSASFFHWYKQTTGQKPKRVSSFYKYDIKGTLTDNFKNIPRFSLDTNRGNNHLTILDLQFSDSATYYCLSCSSYKFTFKKVMTVNVKGSGLKIQTKIRYSGPEIFQQRGSVTVNCTVHTGTCDGGHRVYWFKDFGEAYPGVIYTDGVRNDSCKRKPEAKTHTCIYNLPTNSMNLSHAGTDYCAVASCGQIMFGNGTKHNDKDEENYPYSLMNFLNGALAITIILNISLAFSVCMLTKRKYYSCHCTESQAKFSAPSTTTAEGYEDSDNLSFDTLSDDASRQCVYSSVRQ